jgi:hypothetical protein
MYCKHCGNTVDEKVEICTQCGKRLRSSFSSILENSELTQLRPQQTVKSPGLAGFLGFALGWCLLGPFGYLYLGQWNWFWITIVITIIAYPVTVGFAWVLFPFIFAFHQYQMAKELNSMLEQSKTPEPQARPPYDTGGKPRAPHESS